MSKVAEQTNRVVLLGLALAIASTAAAWGCDGGRPDKKPLTLAPTTDDGTGGTAGGTAGGGTGGTSMTTTASGTGAAAGTGGIGGSTGIGGTGATAGAGGIGGAAGMGGTGGVLPICSNGLHDGDETDTDCGGSCAPCDNGKTCNVYSDCSSGFCPPSGQGGAGGVSYAGVCDKCAGNSDCQLTDYCDGQGVCQILKLDGLTCNNANECSSGHCVDSVCCNSLCDGLCQACDLTAGTCTPQPDGADPDGECAGADTCGLGGWAHHSSQRPWSPATRSTLLIRTAVAQMALASYWLLSR